MDARREFSRFILTGSANVLLVPKLADSLAGRMEILRLHPLSQLELVGKRCGLLSRLFAADFKAGPSGQRQGIALAERMASGGYPAALERDNLHRRHLRSTNNSRVPGTGTGVIIDVRHLYLLLA